MTTSIGAEKLLTKNEQPLIKNCHSARSQRNPPQPESTILQKCSANMKPDKRQSLLLKQGTRQRYLFSSLLLNFILEVLANTVQKENAVESIQPGNEQNYLFTDITLFV